MSRSFKVNVFLIYVFCLLVKGELKNDLKNRGLDLEYRVLEGKIVGGIPVLLENYPFAVQFFNLGALCGGVIINSWSIITSAHCLEINKDISEMRIQIGSKYIYDFNAKRYKVATFVIHEDYNKEVPFACDMAMVFSEKQFQLDKLSKKGILVNTDKWMREGETKFIVTGWGWTQYGGPLSNMSLMMTYLKYVPLAECSRLHKIQLSADMFCLYGMGKRDTCKGDSGGGVLWKGMVVGLTSHGDGCAKKNKPSVYTNIWHLRHWIRAQVFKYMNDYCNSGKMIDPIL